MNIDESSLARRILPLIDLTSLNDTDNSETISKLCAQAITPYGTVAAVCVYPTFVRLAKKILVNTLVKIATVSNFPKGDAPLEIVLTEIKQAIADGADEIDVVMPYQNYLSGDCASTSLFIAACKQMCGNVCLKVILETGALNDAALITRASKDVIAAGADFLKTSTGKITIGATIEAARAMLMAIRDTNRSVGFKASGGIRTLAQAASYLQLADEIMGTQWISPSHFRFGASSLLQEVLVQLQSRLNTPGESIGECD